MAAFTFARDIRDLMDISSRGTGGAGSAGITIMTSPAHAILLLIAVGRPVQSAHQASSRSWMHFLAIAHHPFKLCIGTGATIDEATEDLDGQQDTVTAAGQPEFLALGDPACCRDPRIDGFDERTASLAKLQLGLLFAHLV